MHRADAGPLTEPWATQPFEQLVTRLLDWMGRARRNLPWRRLRTPYAVWISEVMLQQTQVATVIPYFERWLSRFPDPAALAAAPFDDIMKSWEGLGYYARARNLHRAAQLIVGSHGGQIPGERAALLALPGIGRSTAGAILSLAFDQPEPILDGNVRRALCRIHDIEGDPRAPAVEAELWRLAEAWVRAAPAGRAGALNEALMELGALICTPDRPQCPECPLVGICLAHARGTVSLRPLRRRKSPTPLHDVVAAVIQNPTGELLLVRRHDEGLLGGLWGFPGGTVAPGEDHASAVRRTVEDQVGIVVAPAASLGGFSHAYTHFRITLHAWTADWLAGEPQAKRCAEVRWVAPQALEDHPMPVTDRRVTRLLGDDRGRGSPP